ncbi:recombinase family protein [Pararhizobium gei]|uniref:recombinase family protein n=1 Tax=Pararhizobium gei TaxID=1395951 RepID=UPI003312FDC5
MRSPTEIRAFILARAASVIQSKANLQVEQQLKYLSAYAQRQSYQIVGEACAPGTGGNTVPRPGQAVVMDGATSALPAFDVLLVSECTRLVRDPVLRQGLISRLRAAGVVIEFTASRSLLYQEDKSMAKLLPALRRHPGGQDDQD